jgi:methyl-accepting chemotaxis protein
MFSKIKQAFGNSLNKIQKGTSKNTRAKQSIFKKIVMSCSIILIVSLFSSSIFTFIITKNKVEEDFKASAKQLLIQNMDYIDFLSETANATSMQILSDRELVSNLSTYYKDEFEKLNAVSERDKRINNIFAGGANTILSSLTIYNEQGNSVSSLGTAGFLEGKIEMVKKELWYDAAIKANGRAVWIPMHKDTILEAEKAKEYISNVRFLVSDSGQQAGILKININTAKLQNKISSNTLGKSGYIKIVDKDGFIISSKSGVKPGDTETNVYWNDIKDKERDSFISTVDGKNSLVIFETSSTTGWKFVAIIPSSELYSTAVKIWVMNLFITFVFVLVAVAVTTFISRQISLPMKHIVNTTKELANGNFTVSLPKSDIREVDELSRYFSKMIDGLRDTLQATRSLSLESSDASQQLKNISEILKVASDSTTQTVATIAEGSFKQSEEISNCLEFTKQFNEELELTISYIGSIQRTTNTTILTIEEKSNTISQLKDASLENKSAIESVTSSISKLSEDTKDILMILKKINDITDRTNLLALNAAIEAARAGEAGRGFAVVADEVRKLADQSRESADEIKKILVSVQKSIMESVKTARKASENFEDEYEKVDNTIEVFNSIKESFDSILELVQESNETISKLEGDRETLVKSIDNIAAISQDNSAATEEVSATMEEQAASNTDMFLLASSLAEKSKNLDSVVERFKL